MRLIDRLLAAENIGMPELQSALRHAQKIVVDNVAHFFFEVSDKEHWDRIDDFPNVAPPFECFWMEARAPKMINSEIYGLQSWEQTGREFVQGWGVLATATEMISHGEPNIPQMERRIAAYQRVLEQYGPRPEHKPVPTDPQLKKNLGVTFATWKMLRTLVDDLKRGDRASYDALMKKNLAIANSMSSPPRWQLQTFLFIDAGKFSRWDKQPLIGFSWYINGDGTFCHTPGDPTEAMCEQQLPDYSVRSIGNQPTTALGDECIAYVNVALLAISFMHCKNVLVRQVDPASEKNTARESRMWQARHGQPLTKFSVLEIDHLKQTLRSEGRMEETGLHRALHICRGHFARYTPEHPLFGKYVGNFWRPQHVRGNETLGRVEKIYTVK